MKKSHIKHIFMLLVIMMFGVGLYVHFCGSEYSYEVLSGNDCMTLSSGWIVEDNKETVNLPMSFEYDDYSELTLTRKLEDLPEFENLPYLLMSSKYFNYVLYLDDEEIFRFEEPENGFSKTSGYQLRMVRLNNDISKQTIKLKIIPKLGSSIRYTVAAPKAGSRADMILNLIKTELLPLIFDVVILLFGIALLGMYFLMRGNTQGDKLFFIGMLSVFCGIYILCQYQISHLIATNAYMLYYIEFVSLCVIPLIVSIFVGINLSGKIRRLYECLSFLFAMNILAQLILNFAFKVDFKSMLFVTHILIIMLGLNILITVIAYRRDDNIKFMLISLIFPVAGAISDLIVMYIGTHDDVVYYFSFGLYIFIGMQALGIYRQYMRGVNDILMAQTYEKLAFTDGLTGLYNRLSFENDISEKTHAGTTACISVDINNLKEVNDRCGHGSGDILIRAMAEILTEAAGDIGKVYRIGGDEFIIIVKDTSNSEVDMLLKRIENCRQERNARGDMQIEFALGVSFAAEDDVSYEKVIARADKSMYEEKRRMKNALRMGETEN